MASLDTSGLVHTLDSVVRVHHVYKRIWTPTVREQLQKLAWSEQEAHMAHMAHRYSTRSLRTYTDTRLEDVHSVYTHSLPAASVA